MYRLRGIRIFSVTSPAPAVVIELMTEPSRDDLNISLEVREAVVYGRRLLLAATDAELGLAGLGDLLTEIEVAAHEAALAKESA